MTGLKENFWKLLLPETLRYADKGRVGGTEAIQQTASAHLIGIQIIHMGVMGGRGALD